MMAFVDYESDELFKYQWGLKNNGNFFVEKKVLSTNHNILYHNETFAKALFQNDKTAIDNLKLTVNDSSNIIYSEPNIDTNWSMAYALFSMRPNKRDTVVAIIDSGIDITHYELEDNIWINHDEIPNNGIDDDLNGYVDDVFGYNFYDKNHIVYTDSVTDVHGTHAAGTIVAKHKNGGIRGLAYDPHIKVMPLKILGPKGQGTMSSLVEAIKYAKNNGANICNISLGAYTYDANLDGVIRSCSDMIFVVAAGNGANFVGYSLDDRDVYPAKLEYNNVITVSNVSFENKRYVSANYGSYVDVFAPGTFILSTTPENGFGYFTGTSMATPFVTATCAMLYSGYPNLPITQYKNVIVNLATKQENLQGLSKSSGILNIYNSLLYAGMF